MIFYLFLVLQCITFVLMKDEKLVIRVEKAVKVQLQKLAELEGRTLSNYVNMMLLEKIKTTKK